MQIKPGDSESADRMMLVLMSIQQLVHLFSRILLITEYDTTFVLLKL